jgi:hypothetical protein
MRETIQNRILNEIIGCTPQWKVLILDEDVSTRVISSSLTMYDIMEQRVSLVESLGKKRSAFPDMEAVYFCAPTHENVTLIVEDFKEGSPKYSNVHLFFTQALPDEIFDLLKTSPSLLARIKTLKELYLEFMAMEANTFHLDLKSSLVTLFTRGQAPALQSYITKIIKKLSTLCVSLNEYPCIRYQGNSAVASAIANGINDFLKSFKKKNPRITFNGDDAHDDRERAQLLILDRSFDALSPLMHEYTYQAMVYDMLPIENDNQITYKAKTGAKVDNKIALLKDDDTMWVEYRHNHIASVIDSLRTRMQDIQQNNATAQVSKNNHGGANVDISKMAEAVKGISEYKQIVDRLTQHVEIAQQCMASFNRSNLIDVSEVEQCVSTGINDEGKSVSRSQLFNMVVEKLKNISDRDIKKRLIGIFVAAQRPSSAELQDLIKAAAIISGVDQQFIINLNNICAANDTNDSNDGNKKGSFFGSLFGGKKEAVKHQATPEGEFVDSRHQCLLKSLMEQLVGGQLPTDKYPGVGPAVSASSEMKSAAKSVRRFGANSRWNKKESNVTGGRYIAFVAGGVTFSELRSAYELQTQHSKEVIVGGTSFVSPREYMSDLAKIR